MAIALVQSQAGNVTATSQTISFGSNATSGNLVIVAVGSANLPSLTVTDNLGNTYLPVFNNTISHVTQSNGCQFFYAKNITGGAMTITLADTGSVTWQTVIREYSGLAINNPLDQYACEPFGLTGATMSSYTTGRTTYPNELIVGWFIQNASGGAVTHTAGAGFGNKLSTAGGGSSVVCTLEDQIVSVLASQTATATTTVSANTWSGGVITFSDTDCVPHGPTIQNNQQFVKVGDGMWTTEKIR